MEIPKRIPTGPSLLPTGNPPPSAFGWKTLRVSHRALRQSAAAAWGFLIVVVPVFPQQS